MSIGNPNGPWIWPKGVGSVSNRDDCRNQARCSTDGAACYIAFDSSILESHYFARAWSHLLAFHCFSPMAMSAAFMGTLLLPSRFPPVHCWLWRSSGDWWYWWPSVSHIWWCIAQILCRWCPGTVCECPIMVSTWWESCPNRYALSCTWYIVFQIGVPSQRPPCSQYWGRVPVLGRAWTPFDCVTTSMSRTHFFDSTWTAGGQLWGVPQTNFSFQWIWCDIRCCIITCRQLTVSHWLEAVCRWTCKGRWSMPKSTIFQIWLCGVKTSEFFALGSTPTSPFRGISLEACLGVWWMWGIDVPLIHTWTDDKCTFKCISMR